MTPTKTALYLQAPLGLHDNAGLMAVTRELIASGHVAAFLSHSPAFVDTVRDWGLLDKTALMIAEPFEPKHHPDIEGAHLFQVPPNLEAYRRMMGDRAIGIGPVSTKHDAMTLGEQGADYMAFPAAEMDLIEWWAVYTTLPCVAWGAPTIESFAPLKDKGADFICPAPWFWKDGLKNLEAILKIIA